MVVISFQALTIALTSDFVPHLTYYWRYNTHSLKGFLNYTLTGKLTTALKCIYFVLRKFETFPLPLTFYRIRNI